MEIRFACPSCGARFRVPPENAGKRAKCQKCNSKLTVPTPAKQDAHVSGRFSLEVPSPAAMKAASKELEGSTNQEDGLHIPSFADLAAISIERIAGRPYIPDEEIEDSGPDFYRIHNKPKPQRARKRVSGLNPLQKLQRRSVKILLSWLYAVTDFLFMLAIPGFFLFLMCVLIDQDTWATWLAGVIVVLCIARLIVNGICLFIVPFKYGWLKGIFFFIPPFTFYFLYKHWNTFQKSMFKFLNPLLPILGVMIVSYYLPDLKVHPDEPLIPSPDQQSSTEDPTTDESSR